MCKKPKNVEMQQFNVFENASSNGRGINSSDPMQFIENKERVPIGMYLSIRLENNSTCL